MAIVVNLARPELTASHGMDFPESLADPHYATWDTEGEATTTGEIPTTDDRLVVPTPPEPE
jgi:hypothetical protein